MNYYIVVEGAVGEKKVYADWIPYINPNIELVEFPDDASENNFYIIAGNGFPNYFEIIKHGIEDVNNMPAFDLFVIAVDSENLSRDEKNKEICDFVATLNCRTTIEIIVQHFCLETWALGNTKIFSKNKKNEQINGFKTIFDVSKKDPERLPSHPKRDWNRAQFAEIYLRTLLNAKHKNLTYNKKNPGALLNSKYFEQVVKRLETTGHIKSFQKFLDVFKP